MELNKQGPNLTVLRLHGGIELLFSYSIPVAARLVSGEYVKTARFYSRTTTKHVNEFIGQNVARVVGQDVIDAITKEAR